MSAMRNLPISFFKTKKYIIDPNNINADTKRQYSGINICTQAIVHKPV